MIIPCINSLYIIKTGIRTRIEIIGPNLSIKIIIKNIKGIRNNKNTINK